MGAACCSEIDKAPGANQPAPVRSQPSLLPPLPGEAEQLRSPPCPPEEHVQAEASDTSGLASGDGDTQVSEMVDEVTAKEQRQQAKQVVKDFATA
ncbi:unnamed protein product [Symbiodinium natans]|uniref:Uncharacterized protein n=1 Tax=Symbiodinium natans TaxID=878477 RepID=A0A812JKZ5_9DINO|nr:unnamed protein product [Symbiodinium natans]